MPSFKEWASIAIKDTLADHGGFLHWQDLQDALVDRFLHDHKTARHVCKAQLGHRLLAEIPEACLSRDDATVRLWQGRRCASVAPSANELAPKHLSAQSRNCGEFEQVFGAITDALTRWGSKAIDDTLANNGGSMHVRDLQMALLEQYIRQCLSPDNPVGLSLLALIPETYLNHEDSLVRLCGFDNSPVKHAHAEEYCVPFGNTSSFRAIGSKLFGHGLRQHMRKLNVLRRIRKTLPSRVCFKEEYMPVHPDVSHVSGVRTIDEDGMFEPHGNTRRCLGRRHSNRFRKINVLRHTKASSGSRTCELGALRDQTWDATIHAQEPYRADADDTCDPTGKAGTRFAHRHCNRPRKIRVLRRMKNCLGLRACRIEQHIFLHHPKDARNGEVATGSERSPCKIRAVFGRSHRKLLRKINLPRRAKKLLGVRASHARKRISLQRALKSQGNTGPDTFAPQSYGKADWANSNAEIVTTSGHSQNAQPQHYALPRPAVRCIPKFIGGRLCYVNTAQDNLASSTGESVSYQCRVGGA